MQLNYYIQKVENTAKRFFITTKKDKREHIYIYTYI